MHMYIIIVYMERVREKNEQAKITNIELGTDQKHDDGRYMEDSCK